MQTTFSGWWLDRRSTDEDDGILARFRTDIDETELPADGVEVDVIASGLNYKDALAFTGAPGVARTTPLVPGIDVVGLVRDAGGSDWLPGVPVLLNGDGIGEQRHGGLAQCARVPAGSLIRVPDAIGARRAAAIGTAGFTAMLAVLAIERHGVRPGDGPVLVTGAGGGVGTITIALLAALGHEVVASTGRLDEHGDTLRALGASDVVDRAELSGEGRPLQRETWAAVADAVGGETLANAIAQTRYGGVVTASGMVGGTAIPTSVMPFILRGVNLAGINSVLAPRELRAEAWRRLAEDLDPAVVDGLTTAVALADAGDAARNLLDGNVFGRTVVEIA